MQQVRPKRNRTIDKDETPGGSQAQDLADCLIYFLARENEPLDRQLVAKDLQLIGSVSDEVPAAPPWEWSEALDGLIENGLVIESDGMVSLDRSAAEQKQRQDAGMLF